MMEVAAPSSAKRLAPALADGIARCMRDDPRVYVWGEDVTIGVMGPTRGLADEFGPERVIDCPISEAAFVGAAVGAATGAPTAGPAPRPVPSPTVLMLAPLEHAATPTIATATKARSPARRRG